MSKPHKLSQLKAESSTDSNLSLISHLLKTNPTLLERSSTTSENPLKEYFPGPDAPASQSSFVFLPESGVKVLWDVLTSLMILYQAFMYPYFLAFSTVHADYYLFDLSSTLMFSVDVFVNFNTAFYRRGVLITNRRAIALKYARLWLWIDLVSTFPYSWTIEGSAAFKQNSETEGSGASDNVLYSSPTLLRMLRLTRVMSLMRIAKFRKKLREFEHFMSSNQLSSLLATFELLLVMLTVSHWIACLWIFVSFGDLSSSDNWISNGRFEDQSNIEIYTSAMYWSIYSMSSVGFGDIKALNSQEKVVAIFGVVIGSGIFTFIISRISSIVSKQTSDHTTHREYVVKFNKFMKYNDIPRKLMFKVRRYLDYIWDKRETRMLNEMDFLELLSEPLKDAIYFHTRGKVVEGCLILSKFCSKHVLAHMTRVIEARVYAPSDVILEQGERSTDLYFISHGLVEILHHRTKTVFTILSENSYFGQISFFTNRRRKATVHCLEFVETFTLKRQSVDELAERYPELGVCLADLHASCEEGDLTDLDISCYMCGQLGHAAVNCKHFVLNASSHENQAKWLQTRAVKTTLVNQYSLSQVANYARKPKRLTRDQLRLVSAHSHSHSKRYQPKVGFTVAPKKQAHLVINAARPVLSPSEILEYRLDEILSEEESNSDEEMTVPMASRRRLDEL
jgi:hypothetical protein